jgi:hypothetical protein
MTENDNAHFLGVLTNVLAIHPHFLNGNMVSMGESEVRLVIPSPAIDRSMRIHLFILPDCQAFPTTLTTVAALVVIERELIPV